VGTLDLGDEANEITGEHQPFHPWRLSEYVAIKLLRLLHKLVQLP